MTDDPTVCMQANEPQCHCCYKIRAIERECLDRGHTEVDARARLEDAEKVLARVRALADEWESVGKHDRAAARAAGKLRTALDGTS